MMMLLLEEHCDELHYASFPNISNFRLHVVISYPKQFLFWFDIEGHSDIISNLGLTLMMFAFVVTRTPT